MEGIQEHSRLSVEAHKKIKFFINLALKLEISWSTLGSLIADYTSSFEVSKQVIQVLLEELESLNSKFCNEKFDNVVYEAHNDENVTEEVDDAIEIAKTEYDFEEEMILTNSSEFQEEYIVDENVEQFEKEDNLEFVHVQYVLDDDNKDQLDFKEQKFEEDSKPKITKKNAKCRICGKGGFANTNNLRRHEKIHKDKSMKCDICPKTFNNLESLTVHTQMHSGENLFACDTCDKSFNRKSNLTMHQKIHTNERPFQCKTCSKSFKQITNLKYHEKVHRGEKPFECTNCGKRFSKRSNLKSHFRVHSGEKPYKCNSCSEMFKHLYLRKIHERKVHLTS